MAERDKPEVGSTTGPEKTTVPGGAVGSPSTKDTGTGTGTGNTQKEGVPRLVTIADPLTGEVPAPKKAKSKKKKTATKKVDARDMEQNVSMVLYSAFGMMANRNPIWAVDPAEVDQIAKPTARILARLEAAHTLNENADYIMLAVALGLVVGPRLMMLQQTKKTRVKGGSVHGADTARKADEPSRENNRPRAVNGPGSLAGTISGLG